jgi:hypothetical protein
MKSKVCSRILRIIAAVALVSATSTMAQERMPEHLGGIINDYTPLVPATPTKPTSSLYEMRGHWSLHLKGNSGKADFSAFMTMELSDYWVLYSNSDATKPNIRGAHTHHITMTDGTVSSEPSDTSSCPTDNPATTDRFVVSGTANSITGNGNSAPFEKMGPTMLQVCITGGSDVTYSNMTLVFTGPATTHFGMQAIHGAVRSAEKSDEGDRE